MYRLHRDADGWVFGVYVAKGFANWGKEFPVTEAQARRLGEEPMRCDILFALLHKFEQRGQYPSGQSGDQIVQQIAFAPRNSVRRLADKHDDRGDISVGVAWVRGVGKALGPGFKSPDWFVDWNEALKDRLDAD